ncbi:MAG: hypothetical protein WCI67_03905, partial [Chloroflexales bacterium]
MSGGSRSLNVAAGQRVFRQRVTLQTADVTNEPLTWTRAHQWRRPVLRVAQRLPADRLQIGDGRVKEQAQAQHALLGGGGRAGL